MADPSWMDEAEELDDDPAWASDAEEIRDDPSMDAGSESESPEVVKLDQITIRPDTPQRATRPMLPWESRSLMGGMLGGWRDELAARIRSLGGESYDDALTDERRLEAEERAAKPGLNTIGRVAQGAATMAIPGSSIPALAAQGAALGGLTAAGESDADTMSGRLRAAGEGATVGGGTALAASALGRSVAPLGRYLSRKGAEKTAESIGATPTELRKLVRRHGSEAEVGERMRAAGLTGSAGRIAKRSEDLVDQTGQEIGDIYRTASDAVDGAPVVDLGAVRSRIARKAAEIRGMPEAGSMSRVYKKWMKELEGADGETIQRMHQRLRHLQNQAEVPKPGTPRRKAMKAVASAYRDELQKAVGDASPELLDRLRELNRGHSLAKDIAPAAAGQLAREQTAKGGGARDMIASGVGVLTYGPAGALAGLARAPLSRYGKAGLAAAQTGAGRAATGLASTARTASAPAGRLAASESARSYVRSSTDMAREAVRSDPMAFGADGIRLAEAAAQGDREFAAEHWRAMVNSQEYRQSMRDLEAKEREKNERN